MSDIEEEEPSEASYESPEEDVEADDLHMPSILAAAAPAAGSKPAVTVLDEGATTLAALDAAVLKLFRRAGCLHVDISAVKQAATYLKEDVFHILEKVYNLMHDETPSSDLVAALLDHVLPGVNVAVSTQDDKRISTPKSADTWLGKAKTKPVVQLAPYQLKVKPEINLMRGAYMVLQQVRRIPHDPRPFVTLICLCVRVCSCVCRCIRVSVLCTRR